MDAVSAILRQQFPDIGALFNVEFGSFKDGFPETRNHGHWIQIIYVENHWVVAAFDPGLDSDSGKTCVRVYDSLAFDPKSKSLAVKEHVLFCISTVLRPCDDSFSVRRELCQTQSDGYNCGPFAVAFATSLAFGLNPSDLQFDVKKLRPHIRECLHAGRMSPFPSVVSKDEKIPLKKSQRFMGKVKDFAKENKCDTDLNDASKLPKELLLNVVCSCRVYWNEDDSDDMIECDQCKTWFHQKCENVPDVVFNDNKNSSEKKPCEWNCRDCVNREMKILLRPSVTKND